MEPVRGLEPRAPAAYRAAALPDKLDRHGGIDRTRTGNHRAENAAASPFAYDPIGCGAGSPTRYALAYEASERNVAPSPQVASTSVDLVTRGV